MTDELEVLIEEWKQNVSLYVDQDKRGLERTKMFLTLHAGLLIAWGLMVKDTHDTWSICAGLVIAAMGIFLTFITQLMSRRSHAFNLLRRIQAMIVEMKIKEILASSAPWRTSSGIITTFTREHVFFRNRKNIPTEWHPLIDEVKETDTYAFSPLALEGKWAFSIGHLQWLMLLHYALYVLWVLLGILAVLPR